jgi:hypothetical protein
MMGDLEYADLWLVFEKWAQEGKFGDIEVNPHRIDGIDQLIHDLFDVYLENDGVDIHAMTDKFERSLSSKDVDWLLSPHAWTLYKAKEARHG